jgi:hypothetical protein
MKAKLLESARGMQEELVAFRRYLHQNHGKFRKVKACRDGI